MKLNQFTIKNFLHLFLMVCLGVHATSYADQSAANYLYASRYDASGQLTGSILPDPDGSGPIKYVATRNTYHQGLLVKVEKGQLSSWVNENIAPDQWKFSSLLFTANIDYDDNGRKKSTFITGANSGVPSLIQYGYDSRSRLVCEAKRMNPDIFDQLLDDNVNACDLASEGVYGPDRITKYVYENKRNLIIEEWRAYGVLGLQQKYVSNTYEATVYLKGAGETNYNPTRNFQSNRLESQTDANGNKTEYNYDIYERLAKRIYPSKATGSELSNESDYVEYGYDIFGNINRERKRDKSVFIYEYDAHNRMTKKDGPGASLDVVYDYDLRGLTLYTRFSSVSGQGVTNDFDGFGFLKSSTTNVGGTTRQIKYEYDLNGNRRKITHPDDKYFTYEYNGLDQFETIKDSSDSALVTQEYDDFSRAKKLTTANDAAGFRVWYDDMSRVDVLGYDFDGEDFDLYQDFNFNPVGQTIALDLSNRVYHFEGTATQKGAYQPNGLNQYDTVAGKKFDYDPNGNLTSDGERGYVYDTENRLTHVDGNVELKYDPLGRLYQISETGGETTYFLYDGDDLIAEYQGNTMTKRYAHGESMNAPLLSYEGSSVNSGDRQFLHVNHQGSVIAATDNNGSVDYINTYDPYGGIGSLTGRFAYTGQVHLPELDMYYYRARVYNPLIGRFMQTDPVGYEDQMNLYAYVGNDPMNNIDPTGMQTSRADYAELMGEEYAKNAQANKAAQVGDAAAAIGDVIDAVVTPDASSLAGPAGKVVAAAAVVVKATQKLSKVEKSKKVEKIGDKFTKTTKTIPGKGPGQSRAEMEFVKNAEGKVIRSRKFSYDRGNKLQNKKRVRGGPEGRGPHDDE